MRSRRARAGGEAVSAILLLGLFGVAGCENEVGAACKAASDCTAGELCLDGVCRAGETSCTIDADCGPDGLCEGGRCTSPLDQNGGGPGGPGGDGVVRITPAGEIDFGSPALGVGIERVVSLLNVGTGPFSLLGISRAEGTSEEFAWRLERPLPAVIEVGDRVEVTLVYTLADGNDDVGTIYLETDASACEPACDDPARIPIDLLSEFKGERNLEVSPPTHDFGYVPVGEESSARALLLTNDGTLDKVLTVTGLVADGDVEHFSFALPAPPVYLAPGQSLEIPVTYAPGAIREHAVTFTVTANSDSPERTSGTSTFRGTSQPPSALVFDPPEIVFPQIAVGQTAQEISILKNVGGTAITLQALEVGAQSPVEYTAFAAVTLPYTLAPGGELAVYVEFRAQGGVPSATTVRALNNQPSGEVPVLSVRGEGFVPPGGPNVEVVMGPDKNEVVTDCQCDATGDVPAANVDIRYQAAGGSACAKPADPSCGINGGTCACPSLSSYGDVTWSAGRQVTVRGELWIVDERVRHEGTGPDGTFTVRADLLDDCLAVPGSTSYSVNYGCCLSVDCEGSGADNRGPQACYPYGAFPHCPTDCEYFASTATSQDCLMRGPIAVRTRVRIYGGPNPEQVREFCRTIDASGQSADVVTLTRQNGYFQITQVAPNVVEVEPGAPCP